MHQIVILLVEYQQRNKLTDKQMGERMGIHPAHWNKLRRGKAALPKSSVLSGFARLFPRRMAVLRAYLVGEPAPSDGEDGA